MIEFDKEAARKAARKIVQDQLEVTDEYFSSRGEHEINWVKIGMGWQFDQMKQILADYKNLNAVAVDLQIERDELRALAQSNGICAFKFQTERDNLLLKLRDLELKEQVRVCQRSQPEVAFDDLKRQIAKLDSQVISSMKAFERIKRIIDGRI